MTPSPALRVHEAAPKRAVRPKSVEIARVSVLSPIKLARLRTAIALGEKLAVAFDGMSLVVRVDR